MINCRGKTSKTKQKTQTVKIRLLDDRELQLHIGSSEFILYRRPGSISDAEFERLLDINTKTEPKTTGYDLFDSVCASLNLVDRAYFGLSVIDTKVDQRWLDDRRTVISQTSRKLFAFAVKFYCPDPTQLDDEYTRYLFALQIKHDLASGTLNCCDNTANLIASFIVQAEIGDFLPDYDDEGNYLNRRIFYPSQTTSSLIALNHKTHIGQSAVNADLNLLNIARKTEFYGLHPTSAKDAEGNQVGLCASHSGLLVLQDMMRVNTFTWVLIRKIGFKRKKLLIKLQPDKYGYYNETLEFFFAERDQCRQFWMFAIENHGFFRCDNRAEADWEARPTANPGNKRTGVSSYRYTGLTMKESIYRTREMRLGGRLSDPHRFERFYADTRRTRSYQPPETKSSVFRSQISQSTFNDTYGNFMSSIKNKMDVADLESPKEDETKDVMIKDRNDKDDFRRDDVPKTLEERISENLTYQLDERDDSSFTDFEDPQSDMKPDRCLFDQARQHDIASRTSVLTLRTEARSCYSSSDDQIPKSGRLKCSRDVADVVRISQKFIPERNTYSMQDDTISPCATQKRLVGKTTRQKGQPAIVGTCDIYGVGKVNVVHNQRLQSWDDECVNQSGNLEPNECIISKKNSDRKLNQVKTTKSAHSPNVGINSVPPSSPQLLYRPNLQKFKISTLRDDSSDVSGSTSSLEACEISLLSNSSSTFDSSEDSLGSPPIPLTPIDVGQSTSCEELSDTELSSLFKWSPVCSDSRGDPPKSESFYSVDVTQTRRAAARTCPSDEALQSRQLMADSADKRPAPRRHLRRTSSLRHSYMLQLSSEDESSNSGELAAAQRAILPPRFAKRKSSKGRTR